MALTDIAVRQLKPADKPFKVGDERGLYLLINPQGGKLWRWKYRYLGKEKLMALGGYPDVSLAQARDKRDAARKLLAAGGDPMGERHAAKVAQRVAMEDSFEAVARKWWETWKGARSDRHADYVLRRLESDVFPAIGQRPISAIAATELVVMVKRIEARGALDIAKRSLQTCGQVFRYAIAHGKAARNPATCPHARRATMRGWTAASCPSCCARSRSIKELPSSAAACAAKPGHEPAHRRAGP